MRDFIYRWWVCWEGGYEERGLGDGGREKMGTGAGGREFGGGWGVWCSQISYFVFFLCGSFVGFCELVCVMVLNLLLFIKNWTAIMGKGVGRLGGKGFSLCGVRTFFFFLLLL